MKLKLKGRRFDNIEGIQGESQSVLDSLTKRSKNGREGGNGVYMLEGNTSRVTALW